MQKVLKLYAKSIELKTSFDNLLKENDYMKKTNHILK